MGSTTFGALYKKAKDDGAFDDVLPDGDFRVEIKRANAKETKKGDSSIGVQFKIIGEEGGAPIPDDDPAKGKTTWLNLNFSEKAAPISFRQLRDWGFDDEWLSESESAEQIAEALTGIVLDASVGHRNWGANDENVNNTLKVGAVVTPPTVGAAPIVPKADTPDDDGY